MRASVLHGPRRHRRWASRRPVASGFAPAIVDGIRAWQSSFGGRGERRGAHSAVRRAKKELTLTGTFRYANTWPTAIALVASGRIDLDRLVTGSYGLDHVEEALSFTERKT